MCKMTKYATVYGVCHPVRKKHTCMYDLQTCCTSFCRNEQNGQVLGKTGPVTEGVSLTPPVDSRSHKQGERSNEILGHRSKVKGQMMLNF